MFTASNTNITKNRVGKELKQILSISYSFRFQHLICITNFASIINADVIQLTPKDEIHNWTIGTESFHLIASKLQFLSQKNP